VRLAGDEIGVEFLASEKRPKKGGLKLMPAKSRKVRWNLKLANIMLYR
jgi:hypothetical protein